MSSNYWVPDGSCRFVSDKNTATGRMYGHLPTEALDEWARRETMMSYQYHSGKSLGISADKDGAEAKAEMMKKIDELFFKRANDTMKQRYDKELRNELSTRLEDPGLMHNFLYFDIPSSEFMLQFYFAVWAGQMARVMLYLHGYGWDLSEVYQKIPETDVWSVMSRYEGMNISERVKVRELLATIRALGSNISIASFGGGNEPLRLYNPPLMDWLIFDNGDVLPTAELFPDPKWVGHVMYFHENFFDALKRPQLFTTRDLVYMYGLSMYLGQEKLPSALVVAYQLLKPGGIMMFDLLHEMDSIRRVVMTQGWPKGPGEMYMMKTVDDAVLAARQAVKLANVQIQKTIDLSGAFDIMQINPILIEPWGVTHTIVLLRKCL